MIIMIFLIFLIYMFYEVAVFKTNKLKIKSGKVRGTIRIVQISDFHNNVFVNLNRLRKEINIYNPDFIFLTGDIVSRGTSKYAKIDLFLNIFKDYKTYFVDGNHEIDNENKKIYEILDRYGIVNLSGKCETVNILDNDIAIYGNGFGVDNVINEKLNFNNYNILLSHSPENFLNNQKLYDLVLSGHKHGGQIRLPFLGQIIDHGPKFFPKYSKGLYQIENTNFYIDSGLGQSIYIRFFNRISYSQIEIEDNP